MAATNPYKVVEDGLGIHVLRSGRDGVEYWAEVKTFEEGRQIADAEWAREQTGGDTRG